jgi:hypothetical protein
VGGLIQPGVRRCQYADSAPIVFFFRSPHPAYMAGTAAPSGAPEVNVDQERHGSLIEGFRTMSSVAVMEDRIFRPTASRDGSPSIPISRGAKSYAPEKPDPALSSVTQGWDALSDGRDRDLNGQVVSDETPLPAFPVTPPSPMRPATKRSASAAEDVMPEQEGQRKKGRVSQVPSIDKAPRASARATQQPNAKKGASLAARRSVRVLRSSRLKNVPVSSSLSRSSGSTGPSASTSQARSSKESAAWPRTQASSTSHNRLKASEATKRPEWDNHLMLTSSLASSSSKAHPTGKSVDACLEVPLGAANGQQTPEPAGTVKSMGQSEGSNHMRRGARMPIPERLVS